MALRDVVTAPTPPDDSSIGARFISLVLLAAFAQLWVNHHLGVSTQTPWVALSLGTISGVLGLAARLLEDGEKKGLADSLRKVLRVLLNRGRRSVRVLGDGHSRRGRARQGGAPLDRRQAHRRARPQRRPCPICPPHGRSQDVKSRIERIPGVDAVRVAPGLPSRAAPGSVSYPAT